MEMTLTNSEWHSKIEVQKADYGEKLVQDFLEKQGYVCYKPVTDAAHLIDFLVFQDKKFKFGVEVKTKPKFKNYPATGFDYRHYLQYKKFTADEERPLFICFVDETIGAIYGNFLHVLDEPREYCGMDYPNQFSKNGVSIRYYPLSAMRLIRKLTSSETEKLKNFKC